jgi:pimeloyl-ACP methyl ester carboxylesterase
VADKFEHSPDSTEPFTNSSLHVYRRTDIERHDAIVVLIHGLSGSGQDTWRHLGPALYASSVLRMDVGIFDYPSGTRWRPTNNSTPDDAVRLLMQELTDLPYSRIHLVGHSMGGVIASSAMRRSFTLQLVGRRLIDKVRSLTLLATPRAGSRRVPPIGAVWPDGRYIATHAEVQADNDAFLKERVDMQLDTPRSREFFVPVLVAAAAGDPWVDSFSSTYGVPEAQIKRVSGSDPGRDKWSLGKWLSGPHTAMLGKRDLIDWLCGEVSGVDSLAAAPRALRPSAVVLATYKGHPAYGHLFDCYQSAIESFRSQTPGARIVDMTNGVARGRLSMDGPRRTHIASVLVHEEAQPGGGTGSPPPEQFGLHVQVIPTEFIDEANTQRDIDDLRSDLEQERLHALGVSAFGEGCMALKIPLSDRLGSGATTWVEAVESTEDLAKAMLEWLGRSHRLANRLAMSEPRWGAMS